VLFFLSNLDQPIEILLSYAIGLLLALLIGMTVHEWAHNYVAHLMGDPVPARLGRLTLNPAVHIYWPGFVMALLIGYGVLGTAPIAAHRMRNPRYGYLMAVAAGPVSNLILAVLLSLIYRGLFGSLTADGNFELIKYVLIILAVMIQMNILLFLFNLLPFSPLDGWSLVYTLLPAREAIWWERNRQNSQLVFFALIFIGFAIPGFSPLSYLISQPLGIIFGLLVG